MTNSVSCTATFVQHAGRRRARGATTPRSQRWWRSSASGATCVVDGLNRIPGVTCTRPRGAFYVFPNVKALGPPLEGDRDRTSSTRRGWRCCGGTAFGEFGEGYLRLSYAASREAIQRGAAPSAGGLRGSAEA